MQIITAPDLSWSAELACHRCGATMRADQGDLAAGGFKLPGTFWFAGAEPVTRIYVTCPCCGECVFVDGAGHGEQMPDRWRSAAVPEIPALLRERLLGASR